MAITHPDGSITHSGVCLFTHMEYNSSMDIHSYYVTVYDNETGEFSNVYVNCDYPTAKPQATFTIDATDAVKAIWEAKQAAARKAEHDRQELIEVMTPRVGKRLNVFKGRKVAKGTTGECFWIGQSAYGVRVGIKDNAGEVHWTSIDNVEVI